MAAAAQPQLVNFSPQNLANLVWPFAHAGHQHPSLFYEAAQAAMSRGLDRFAPAALANLLEAFAKAGHSAPRLFEHAADIAEVRIYEYSPSALATLAWSFASAGCAPSSLFDALAAAVATKLREFTPVDLARTAWAFACASFAVPRSWSFAAVWAAGGEGAGSEVAMSDVIPYTACDTGLPPADVLAAPSDGTRTEDEVPPRPEGALSEG